MAKAPAFQFYANDFMDSTRFWEANAVGLYVRCLCIQWTHGGLPTDVRMLASGVGMAFEEFERAWKVVASKFQLSDDGLLKNSRLEVVRSRQADVSSKRSDAGKAGANAKANAKANGSTKTKQRKVKVEGEGNSEKEAIAFEDAWAAYGRHGSKVPASNAWGKLSPADHAACFEVIPAYVKATTTDGTYPSRKHFATYLNTRGWEDTIPTKALPPGELRPLATKPDTIFSEDM